MQENLQLQNACKAFSDLEGVPEAKYSCLFETLIFGFVGFF